MHRCDQYSHRERHAFTGLNARLAEGVQVFGRRSMLKASVAGMAGASVPRLLEAREAALRAGKPTRRKSVILLWMTGGPSHIDTWDPKPEAPLEIRGPFGTIPTALPGIALCEYLPRQAALMDKLTIIRSVDCRFSNHEPNMVMQTANRAAAPRVNKQEGDKFPALASVIARERLKLHRDLPPSVVLNMKSRSHVAWGGYLGRAYDPFNGNDVGQLFSLPSGLDADRLANRRVLNEDLDRMRRGLDLDGSMEATSRFNQQAFDMVLGDRARLAFDISQEPEAIRARYGSHEWSRQVLLARRLVEAGVSFVTIDLSHHGASGTWDTHGDNIPPYGGIWNGLRPLLPVFDHLLTTLVNDLDERGLLEDVLVLAMGEFGRTPQIGTQGSTDGRNHWPFVMSMTLAGGGLQHGRVIGASDRIGGEIKDRPVTPGDLGATILKHMGVPLEVQYLDHRGRPRFVLEDGGTPLGQLSG